MTTGVVLVLIIIVVPTVVTVTQSGDDDFAGTCSYQDQLNYKSGVKFLPATK